MRTKEEIKEKIKNYYNEQPTLVDILTIELLLDIREILTTLTTYKEIMERNRKG